MEIALSGFAGPRDIITPISEEDEITRRNLGYRGAQNYQFGILEALLWPSPARLRSLAKSQRPEKFFNHCPAALAKLRLGPGIWNDFEKISIIRNPFDRAVSRFYWHTRGDRSGKIRFEDWCLANRALLAENQANYFINGNDVIDTYIRFEHFEPDLKALEASLPALSGLFDIFSGIRAKSDVRPTKGPSTKQMFESAPKARALIERVCAPEIAAHRYVLS